MPQKILNRTPVRPLLALSLLAPLLPAYAQPPPGERPPPVVSPEVSSDREVTLRLRAAKADTVHLASSDFPGVGFGQSRSLTRKDDGLWEITLGPVKPGSYRYHFIVNGISTTDPVNLATSESNEMMWSLVHVPGASFLDRRNIPQGAVSEIRYWSSTLRRFRRLHVYTPHGYEASTERYPILYLLHGAFDSDDSWSTVGRAGTILDNLIADGRAVPMVVVMPHGHTGPFQFGMPFGGDFEKEFVADILPQVEDRYRLHGDRAHRALAGLSMGGSHTLNIGIPHLDRFGYLGVYSSGIFGIVGGFGGNQEGPTFEQKHQAVLDNASLKEELKLFWFATGSEDFLVETTRATVAMLKNHDFDVVYDETAGGHTWENWRAYLHAFAPMLFR